jgi:hypothetical protein
MTRPTRCRCPECGEKFADTDGGLAQDHKVDHLADRHDVFRWVVNGRPAPRVVADE